MNNLNIYIKLILNKTLLLTILFIFAFIVRLYFALDSYHTFGKENWADATLYLDNGISFAKGDIYPTTNNSYSYMIVGPVIPLLAISYG